MSLRTTLSHLKSAARGAWVLLKNWRMLWHIHTEIREDPLLSEVRCLNEDVRECNDCDESGRCEYHHERTKEVQRKIDRELEEIDWYGGSP